MRILVYGLVVRWPMAGNSWFYINYLKGLLDLGHDVFFIEDSGDYESCYNPIDKSNSTNPDYGLRHLRSAFSRFGLEERWCYYDAHKKVHRGPIGDDIENICKSVDILLNVAPLTHMNPLRPWLSEIPRRVFVDSDPVFRQVMNLTNTTSLAEAQKYNIFFTYGENYGQSDCQIPDDGFIWQPTRPPIVLDLWPWKKPEKRGALTSVLQWDSYKKLLYNNTHYGMKSESFDPIMDLPRETDLQLELAASGSSLPEEKLLDLGWKLRNPDWLSRDVFRYQSYIQRSLAEFSVAKHGYVATNSGWFSERSTAYLASGKPVVLEETGFSRWLGSNDGVIPFSSRQEAIEALRLLDDRYCDHCRGAREIAEQVFDSRIVLSSLIERVMSTSVSPVERKS